VASQACTEFERSDIDSVESFYEPFFSSRRPRQRLQMNHLSSMNSIDRGMIHSADMQHARHRRRLCRRPRHRCSLCFDYIYMRVF
jgi:hypothetical protein